MRKKFAAFLVMSSIVIFWIIGFTTGYFAHADGMGGAGATWTTQQIVALITGNAPVTSVNSATGAVVVPTVCIQSSASIAIPTTNPGAVSWTFPNSTCAFSVPPSCWMDVTTGSATAAFDFPLNTSRTTTSVTYAFTAHAVSVAVVVSGVTIISVGGTSGAPPSGSTIVLTCRATPA